MIELSKYLCFWTPRYAQFLRYFINPLNPRNASERSPAATYSIGVPLNDLGTFAALSLLLTPDIMTMLSKNPNAEPSA